MECGKIVCLGLVFLVIGLLIRLRKPLWMAIGGGILASLLLYRISPADAVQVLARETVSSENISVLMSFYLVTFLQKMLEHRNRLSNAQQAFSVLFQNRRINAAVSSTIIGLLPSAAVMTVCAEMVDHSCGQALDKKEKLFVSCYYRHIPEMFLPTFSAVLLALTINHQNAGLFVLCMLPSVAAAYLLPFFFYLRKVPAGDIRPLEAGERRRNLLILLKNLWSLLAVVLLIICLGLSVCQATPLVILAELLADRFRPRELLSILREAAEPVLLVNIYLVMLFKAIITHTGVVAVLPDFFQQFPIPVAVSFALIFFAGSVVSGSQAIIALCLPMAMAAIPNGGIALMVLLMSIAWAAMQISPTHVCAFVACQYYGTTLGDLLVKALPVLIPFCLFAFGYSMVLGLPV